MNGRRALLLVNRHARSGAADLTEAVARLRAGGIFVDERTLPRARHVPDLIREAAGDADIVVLGGGDGTMNKAAEAVIEAGKPLGILPLGTANDLARTLGIPSDPIAAAEIIVGRNTRRIDLGRVNGKHFFNVASIGMSVEVARRLTKRVKRRWGVLGYAISSLDTWRQTRPFRARIHAGGSRLAVRSIQIAVGNGRFYGGGMSISEDALIDDAMLDLYSIEPGSLWRMALLLPALRVGRLRRNEAVRCLRAAEIEITTARPMAVDTDGELTTETPARFAVVPQAIEVFVPESPGPGFSPTGAA